MATSLLESDLNNSKSDMNSEVIVNFDSSFASINDTSSAFKKPDALWFVSEFDEFVVFAELADRNFILKNK